jgi:OOP family OmpA-OmpF porin
MSDSPLRIVPTQTPKPPLDDDSDSTESSSKQGMDELRRLLVEPEQIQISNILERLNNPRVRAREMSRNLTDAVRLRAAEDESLSDALGPTIVSAFHKSVKKDPVPVADAIAPLMGPAIRRAISMALNSMVQKFDQALTYSLSAKGLKWRIEAMRTGKSFAEVVMIHTLVFRVEQVFLIHKQSGVLLHHVADESVKTQDADIVSGMMTAMREANWNFGRDSFGLQDNQHPPNLSLTADLEVWFESAKDAVLAVVIRGNAPESLRSDYFAPAIEAIYSEQSSALESFDGDTTPFELSRPHLESCLQAHFEGRKDPAKFKVPFYVWLLLGLVVAGIAAWAFFAWRDGRRWNDYLNRLRSQPGIVITEEGRRDGHRFVAGLRDPLAADPQTILKEQTRIDPSSVASHWIPFQAFDPGIVEKRAKLLLDPPQGVELKLNGETLSASGSAPHDWIVDAQKLARVIPGATSLDTTNLNDLEVESLRGQIERQLILFPTGSSRILSGQRDAIDSLVERIRKLISLSTATGRIAKIEIAGHTDAEGDETANKKLRAERAAQALELLISRGVAANDLSIRDAGLTEPVRLQGYADERVPNRSVTFKISLLHARKPPPQQPKEPVR